MTRRPAPTAAPSGTQRGFALLIVLWLLVPLSMLFLMLTGTARSDAQLTGNLRAATELEAAADGAINTVIFDLLRHGGSGGQASTGPSSVAATDVEIVSQSGLVNPNVVSVELLQALLLRLGVDPAQAARLAVAIVDWRTPGQRAGGSGGKSADYRAAGLQYGPPGAPFETMAELRDVLGMTPAILAAVTPYLTLYADRDPDPASSPAVVQAALRDVGAGTGAAAEDAEVVRITATAQRPAGRIVRRAVIRIGFSANRRGWRVLAWDTAPDA
jgi:general secretion pathway protein K